MFALSTQALLSARKTLDVDSHRQRIDGRLAELHAEMRALKTCRNSLANPMNLPPEILSEIFLLVYLDCQNRPLYPGQRQRWILIMHVCAHWRRVAFGCAGLWTTPTFSNPALTEFQLSRAGQAPLTVEYSPSRYKSRRVHETVRGVLSQTHRLRSINIEKAYGHHPRLPQQALLGGCSGRAPYLEYVRIHDSSLEPGFEIPSQFLAGGAPALKFLELHHCRATNWNALPFSPSLTSLKLTAKPPLGSNPARPSWENLVQSLKQMPLLRTLHLADFLPFSGWPLSSQYGGEARSSYTLQGITTLKLHYSTPATVIQFLDLFSFPNASDVEFTFSQVETLGFLDSFFTKLRTAQGHEFSSVQELQLCGPSQYGSTLLLLKCSSGDRPSLNLGLKFEGPAVTPDGPLRAAGKVLDFSFLSILEVANESGLSTEIWTSIFGPLKMLRRISLVGGTSISAFSDALAAANASGGFSTLSNLTLRKINFKKQRANVCDALDGRPGSAPLITLSIEEPRHFSERRRKEIVDNAPSVEVIWDGANIYYSNSEGSSATETSDDSEVPSIAESLDTTDDDSTGTSEEESERD